MQSIRYSKMEVVLQKATTEVSYFLNDAIIGEIKVNRSKNSPSTLECEIFRAYVKDVNGKIVASFFPEEGDSISLRIGGVGVFFGWIREMEYRVGERTIAVTAYDQLYFLANNSDVQNYGTTTAGNLTRQIINDFRDVGQGLRTTGAISGTGYWIDNVILDGGSLLDCIMDALDTTLAATGKNFYLIDNYSNLQLLSPKNLADWTKDYFHVTHQTVTGTCTIKRSIMDTKTRFKVILNDEDKGYRRTVITWSQPWMDRYGTTQGFYECSTDEDPLAMSKSLFSQNCKRGFHISVTGVAGWPHIWGGSPVYVDFLSNTKSHYRESIRGWFRVDSVVMHFQDGKFTLDLELELDYME